MYIAHKSIISILLHKNNIHDERWRSFAIRSIILFSAIGAWGSLIATVSQLPDPEPPVPIQAAENILMPLHTCAVVAGKPCVRKPEQSAPHPTLGA